MVAEQSRGVTVSLSAGAASSAISALFGTSGPTPVTGGAGPQAVPTFNALGNVFSGGRVIALARGGILTRPILFPMANGMGLAGENGPEAVMPLSRGRDGKLGVNMNGGLGGGSVSISVVNKTDAKASVSQKSGGGPFDFEVLLEQIEGKIASNVGQGRGPLIGALQSNFGMQRKFS